MNQHAYPVELEINQGEEESLLALPEGFQLFLLWGLQGKIQSLQPANLPDPRPIARARMEEPNRPYHSTLVPYPPTLP